MRLDRMLCDGVCAIRKAGTIIAVCNDRECPANPYYSTEVVEVVRQSSATVEDCFS